MNKPESICVSLDTAKRLKEAGFDKETVFVWRTINVYSSNESIKKISECCFLSLANDAENSCHLTEMTPIPAPTSSEITLPKNIENYDILYCLDFFVGFNDHKFIVRYRNPCNDDVWLETKSTSEAEARAEIWLLLKDKGLI